MLLHRLLACVVSIFLMLVMLSGCCICQKQTQISPDQFIAYNKNFKTVMIEANDDRYSNLQRRIDILLEKIDGKGGEVISVSIVHEYYEYKNENMPYSVYHGVITYRLPIDVEPVANK